MKYTEDGFLRKSMKISITEGVFAQIFSTLVSIGNTFITKYAILLKASPIHFSCISAISQLSQIFQLIGVIITRKVVYRKHKTVFYALLGRSINFLLFVPLLIANTYWALTVFLIILFASAGLQNISGNIWTAWIADLIPKNIRGRFFSGRMQVLMFFGLISGYVFSIAIDLFETNPEKWSYPILQKWNLLIYFVPLNQKYALFGVFLTGTIIGILGLFILNKQPEKPRQIDQEEQVSLLEPLRNSNFRKLALFNIWWMLAVGIGAPFWGAFMMKTLKMSLFEIQLYSTIQSITMLIVFRWWGSFIDRFGNRTTMKICIILGSINPLMWIFFTPSSYSLIWFEAVLSGIMWSGANIVSMNFVLAIAPPHKVQVWSGMYAALGGTMMMTTMLLSGFFFPKPMNFLGLHLESEQVLFAITGLLRLTAEIPLQYVKEPAGKKFRVMVKTIWHSLLENVSKRSSQIKKP